VYFSGKLFGKCCKKFSEKISGDSPEIFPTTIPEDFRKTILGFPGFYRIKRVIELRQGDGWLMWLAAGGGYRTGLGR